MNTWLELPFVIAARLCKTWFETKPYQPQRYSFVSIVSENVRTLVKSSVFEKTLKLIFGCFKNYSFFWRPILACYKFLSSIKSPLNCVISFYPLLTTSVATTQSLGKALCLRFRKNVVSVWVNYENIAKRQGFDKLSRTAWAKLKGIGYHSKLLWGTCWSLF